MSVPEGVVAAAVPEAVALLSLIKLMNKYMDYRWEESVLVGK